MIKLVKPLVIIFVILAVIANAYFYISKNNAPNQPILTPAQTELIKTGAKCLDFGERSVANDVPIIEFQMVVRLAKKTTTINNCMTDNGYKQNPQWLKYAQPIVQTLAFKSKSTSNKTNEKTIEASKKIPGEVLKNQVLNNDVSGNEISKSETSGNEMSESEALTNLSRVDMQIFEPKDHPPYWVKR